MKKINVFTVLLFALLMSGQMWAGEACDTLRAEVYDTLCCQQEAQEKYDRLVITGSGVYYDTLPSLVTGCDSITTYNIQLLADNPEIMPTESGVICDGGSMMWRGQQLSAEGLYKDTVRFSKSGCPGQIFSIYVSVNRADTMLADTAICPGDTLEWRGQKISQEGTYRDTARYLIGCDSVLYTLEVKINRLTATEVQDTIICDSNLVQWVWRGKQITKADTTYYDTIRYQVSGCDSVLYILNVWNAYTQRTEVYDTLCNQLNAQEKYKQFVITDMGAYSDTLASKMTGCDSIVTYNIYWLMDNPDFPAAKDTMICAGEVAVWRGKEYSVQGTYYDTLTYAATGCDSVIYTFNLTVNSPDILAVTNTICPGDSMEWRGQMLKKEGMYYDTISSKLTGCDSMIYVMDLKVHYMVEPVVKDTFICDGNFVPWKWRGIAITKADSTYRDTIPYRSTGCDSVEYVLNVLNATTQFTEVYDTLCLIDAELYYTRLNITGTGVYVDTIPSVVSQCDSIITYYIQILADPVMPKLESFDQKLLPVICGENLVPAALVGEVIKAAKIHSDTVADFYEIWLEVKMSAKDEFTKVVNQAVIAGADSIELRLAGTNSCDRSQKIYGSVLQRQVDIPTADNLPRLDAMPASQKYNNWLLVVNYNLITAKQYGFGAENVTWYRVVGDVDPVLAIGDDELVGRGYYYTADKSLTGKYYAVIQDVATDCAPVLRTAVLTCSAEQTMALNPSIARRGAKMTLSQIDPEQSTQISIYNMEGVLIRSIAAEGVDSYQVDADQTPGIYLLRAINGDKEETFRFIVTQ